MTDKKKEAHADELSIEEQLRVERAVNARLEAALAAALAAARVGAAPDAPIAGLSPFESEARLLAHGAWRDDAIAKAAQRFTYVVDFEHHATASRFQVEVQQSRSTEPRFALGRVTSLHWLASDAFNRAVDMTFLHAFSAGEQALLLERSQGGAIFSSHLDDGSELSHRILSVIRGLQSERKQKAFVAGSQRVMRELVGNGALELPRFGTIHGIRQTSGPELPPDTLERLRAGIQVTTAVVVNLDGAPPCAPAPRPVDMAGDAFPAPRGDGAAELMGERKGAARSVG